MIQTCTHAPLESGAINVPLYRKRSLRGYKVEAPNGPVKIALSVSTSNVSWECQYKLSGMPHNDSILTQRLPGSAPRPRRRN